MDLGVDAPHPASASNIPATGGPSPRPSFSSAHRPSIDPHPASRSCSDSTTTATSTVPAVTKADVESGTFLVASTGDALPRCSVELAQRNAKIEAELEAHPDRMPRSVYFIIPNEFAERYCFYGITPLLKNYFVTFLGYSVVDADQLYHVFKSVSFFTPLLGAALSDSWLNKFNTVMWLSSLYTLGVIGLSVFSIPGLFGGIMPPNIPKWGPLLSIFTIALGTGGIKPCVSAHGGDQFLDVQKFGLQRFYNYFYMSINTGSMISSFVSPIIQQRSCYGGFQDCYAPAYGHLAAIMFFSTVIFAVGRRWYRIVPATGQFMPWEMCKVGGSYIAEKFRARTSGSAKNAKEAREVAVRKAEAKFGKEMVQEMFEMVRVFLVLLPSPFFWMAFDQNGSTWQDMGDQMSQKNFLSSQIVNNATNPIFIVILAPLFANYLYPFMDRVFPKRFGLLQRMVVGMMLAGVAFIVGAVLQKKISATCTPIQLDPNDPSTVVCRSESVHIAWQVLMYFIITVGEVLFSISGLNFTYVEVGPRMKSSCAAIWLLYVAIGDALAAVLLNATMDPDRNAKAWTREQFFYLVAGLCFASAGVQFVLSLFYTCKADRDRMEEEREAAAVKVGAEAVEVREGK
ncbi:hypothetical protein HDU96_007269 [Phlyctochytrium bullatum]|nr:hypothetical protein HDU96_007269 [Phlyctochytrium bullatum]